MTPHASRRRFIRATGLVIATGLAGCSTGSGNSVDETTTESATTTESDPTTSTTTETSGETTTTAEASGPRVEMRTDNKGSYFTPKGLLVEPGTTVTFVNESGAHAVTAYHPDFGDKPLRIPEEAEPWDSPVYSESGSEYEVTLDVPGVYDYYCPPHEVMGMVGRVIVGEPQGGPGTTELTDMPPAAKSKMPSIEDILEEGVVEGP